MAEKKKLRKFEAFLLKKKKKFPLITYTYTLIYFILFIRKMVRIISKNERPKSIGENILTA